MFVWYGSEWELTMTCSRRYRGDTRHQKYEQISEITDNQESSLLAHFQPRIEPLVTCYPGLDYENCGVISQIFTGCKWELICTLLTLIGKQIEKLHCQLSLARDGATDNQRINTRQNAETVPRSPGSVIDSTDGSAPHQLFATSAFCLENLQKLYL